ncbi:hypothetical protein Cadr_000012351 [Camelus dromedarius]|uniref:Uncharacterized protein n=1 Tax=Camelus dromedarius TaxID=9838 RepID=A0A5N4DRI4_CAMDR|nr:hypothetical protein Cadr_000012351 [Camelus dromedarius]
MRSLAWVLAHCGSRMSPSPGLFPVTPYLAHCSSHLTRKM